MADIEQEYESGTLSAAPSQRHPLSGTLSAAPSQRHPLSGTLSQKD